MRNHAAVANRITSTKTFSLTSEPDVTVTPTDVVRSEVDPSGLAARLRDGLLDADDEQARINGRLGGVTSDRELHERLQEATGGHDEITPVGNPAQPANPAENAFHPGVDRHLVKGA